MNKNWEEFLAGQSALIEGNHVSFADAPQAVECAICDLSNHGLIAAEGEDLDKFLQGQLTNDIRELTTEHWQLAGFCNAKGRMFANFLLFRRGDSVFMQLPAGHLEAVLKRMGMFVLMAKVSLQDASNELVRIGLCGECAPDLVKTAVGAPPEHAGDAIPHGEVTVLRLPGGAPRFELVGPVACMIGLWQQFTKRATPVNADLWALENIRSGLPVIGAKTAEMFVPQMANMQLVDGVSFTKGCYTGQEVVARMQYLGKLKRRMYLAHVDSETRPEPGMELGSEASQSGQGAGRVVDAQPVPEGGYDLLAVLEITAAEEGDIRLGDDGPRLEIKALPYPFEDKKSVEE
ncbi:MAG TPA: folate-binding protein [Chromatiales bacterium]|nr:folate-binding protein [Chromatiales bacterium]